jgi:hypothetical protein
MNRWAMKMLITVLAVLLGVTASAQSVSARLQSIAGTQQIQRVVAMLPFLRWRNLRGASGA